jgi:hypothetical protein
MSKIEIFLRKAAEFDALAAQAHDPGLAQSYTTVAHSYRRLVRFMENNAESKGLPSTSG